MSGATPATRSTVYDAVIVGGGIAGLSVAAALAPHMRVCLLERGPVLAGRASGRNAAIFRPLEADDRSTALARRSLELLSGLADHPVLSVEGLALAFGGAAEARAQAERACRLGVAHQVLDGDELTRLVPPLATGETRAGLLLQEGGVLDIHEVTSCLARFARQKGATLMCAATASAIEAVGGRVCAVHLADGRRFPCCHAIIAAGAWSSALGRTVRAPLPLTPMRRHLVQLALPDGVRADGWPVLWRLDQPVYFRRQGSGLLACPCDETPFPEWLAVEDPPMSWDALEALAWKMARTAPRLSDLAVHRAWACFRTFAPDRELVAGTDPRVDGLHWLSALGGRGMGVGPAVGELVAQAILGAAEPAVAPFAVHRLLVS